MWYIQDISLMCRRNGLGPKWKPIKACVYDSIFYFISWYATPIKYFSRFICTSGVLIRTYTTKSVIREVLDFCNEYMFCKVDSMLVQRVFSTDLTVKPNPLRPPVSQTTSFNQETSYLSSQDGCSRQTTPRILQQTSNFAPLTLVKFGAL